MAGSTVTVRPILSGDAAAVAAFLHENLNSKVSRESWAELLTPPWGAIGPNHGFQLLSTAEDGGETIVGAYLAVYSERESDGERIPVCNLAAFCVLDEYRAQGLLLVRALLRQKGFEFTDLSPSGNVVAMNERLGFTRLDTSTRLVANLPGIARGASATGDAEVLSRVLRGRDAEVFSDHRHAAAARHLAVLSGDEYAYLVFRADRRKGLPLFATPLYLGGDPRVLESGWRAAASHLLLRHGLAFTLAERRVLGFTPGPGIEWAHPRPKMLRGTRLDPGTLDYLYSELALVGW